MSSFHLMGDRKAESTYKEGKTEVTKGLQTEAAIQGETKKNRRYERRSTHMEEKDKALTNRVS